MATAEQTTSTALHRRGLHALQVLRTASITPAMQPIALGFEERTSFILAE